MVNFSIAEAHGRTDNLMEDCQNAKINTQNISEKIEQVKSRIKDIECKMGIYTGEDKYFI